MGNSTVTELQFREILALFFHTVDKYLASTDYLPFYIFWMMSLNHIKVKKYKFSSSEMIYSQKSIGNGITAGNEGYFFNNFENNVYEICSTWGLD